MLLVQYSLFAQVTFNNTYNQFVDNNFNVIQHDSYYYNVMTTFDSPSSKFVINKLDTTGNIVLQKVYGDSLENFVIYSLLKAYDDNFIMGSYFRDANNLMNYFFVCKFNSNCDTLWTRKFNNNPGHRINGIYTIETSDYGFLISGQIVDTNSTDANMYIAKFDSIGNYEWSNQFGGSNFESAYSSVETSDQGFLTTGWTRSFGFGNNFNRDDIVVKWDSLGTYQWHKTYGTLFNETALRIQKLQDGNFIIGSGRNDLVQNIPNGKLLKIDMNGNVIWQKFYGAGLDAYWQVHELSNNELIACGSIRSNGIDDGFLIKTDSSGNELWRRQYRYGNEHCYFRDVYPTVDGGFICAGFVFEGNSGGQDGWLVKLDSFGCLATSCGEPTGLNQIISQAGYQIEIYPNPIQNVAIVKINGLPDNILTHRYVLKLIDVRGKMHNLADQGFLITDQGIEFELKRNNFASGLYFLQITTDKGNLLGTIKIILL